MLFERFKKLLLFASIICLPSCVRYGKQYACYDYYQIRVHGDSMLIINFTKSVETGNDQQDTTILYLDDGQFYLDDGSLLFSNKTDTSYLRKLVYYQQEEKQVISIKRKDSLNYSTIQTYFEDYGKHNTISTSVEKELFLNRTWRLYMSKTFIYDDNYRIVNIIQNGVWFSPSQLSNLSDVYTLKNNDIITCKKEGNKMTIAFYLRQKDGIIKKDSLHLHLEDGEYLNDDNKLFLSSDRDTMYLSPHNDKKNSFQMVIGHSSNHNKIKYSICWDIICGDSDSVTVALPKKNIEVCDVPEIIHINESRMFLYDCEYNIIGVNNGLLGFFPKTSFE